MPSPASIDDPVTLVVEVHGLVKDFRKSGP
jgi:hypothetical protein